MTRTVLVGWAEDDWRLYRQPQWMAEVRRSPGATRLPRHHFDLGDEALAIALESWAREGAGTSFRAATGLLAKLGAAEVAGPG